MKVGGIGKNALPGKRCQSNVGEGVFCKAQQSSIKFCRSRCGGSPSVSQIGCPNGCRAVNKRQRTTESMKFLLAQDCGESRFERSMFSIVFFIVFLFFPFTFDLQETAQSKKAEATGGFSSTISTLQVLRSTHKAERIFS